MSKQGRASARRRMPFVVAAVMGLAGCGGGGGNVKSTPASPPPAPPPTTPSDQPPIDAHLALTDAVAAHDAGFTGAGVTIGVVDTGINANHPALAGRVKALLVYVDPSQNDTTKDDVVGHGTWVSQIAAGKPFGQWPGGIAPDATLVSARIISDKEPSDDGSGQGNKVEPSDADFFGQTLLPDLINQGVQVMNNSWGGLYFDPSNASAVGAAFGNAFRSFVIDHNGLVVFATGNDSGTQPSDTAAIPYYAPDLERGWLAVAALDSNTPTQLASYSNQCGKAMNYCLTAPGDVIVTGANDTAGNPSYYFVQGTSFATPAVAGAAADVWQAFPYFTNDLVRQTLLGTAKDLGAAGVDPVFGYGLLDVGKAVKGPAQFNWGDVTVSFTGSSTWGNAISGAGGLIKQGTGTLTLSQPSTYTGLTQVQAGGLVANSLAGSVTIAALANFGSGHVGGDIANNGTLDIGNAGGTTVGGNYTQNAGGRLALSLGSVLTVSGKATLNGGDLYVYDKNSNYTVSSHTNVLTAAGGLTGTFTGVDTPSNVLLTATLQYDGGSAWLNVSQINVTQVSGTSYTAASYGAAQRVQGTFEYLDAQLSGGSASATSSSVLSGASSLQHVSSTAALEQSLQSLSGQLHAASAAMTFEAIDAGTRALSDHVDQLLDGNQASLWSQSLGYHGDMSRAGYGNVGIDLDGWMTGADQRLGANGFAGYAISQANGLGRLTESADQGRSHAMEAMLYGGMVKGSWYAMGRFGTGEYRETMRRFVQLGDVGGGVASDTNGRYDVVYGESGYRFASGGLRLTPYMNLQYAQIRRDGFSEVGGSGFGLKSPSELTARWQAGIGLRAGRSWAFGNGTQLSWQSHLLWQRAFGLRGDVLEASFTGVEQWAPVGGIGVSRYGGMVGSELDWSFSPHSSLGIGLDQYVGQRDHARMATINYRLYF